MMQTPPILPIKSFPKTKESKPFKENLKLGNSILDFFLKASAVSLVIGAFVAHQYLKSIGFGFLFPTIIGSQGGLLMIVFGLGLFVFLVFTLFAATPWLAMQARDLADKVFDSKGPFSFFHLLFLFISAPASVFFSMLYLGTENTGTWPYFLIQGVVTLIWLFSSTESRSVVCSLRRNPWMTMQRELLLSVIAIVGVIWISMFFSILPWLFVLALIKDELSNPADQNLYGQIALAVWIVLYGVLCAWLTSRDERRQGDAARVTIVVILLVVLALLLNLPRTFVNAAMYGASLRENSSDAKLYVVDEAVYRKLMPGPNKIPTRKLSADKDLYVCAYSPFLYVDKKILCDADEKKPNAQACVLFNDSEARVIAAPKGTEKCAQPEQSAKPE